MTKEEMAEKKAAINELFVTFAKASHGVEGQIAIAAAVAFIECVAQMFPPELVPHISELLRKSANDIEEAAKEKADVH